VFRRLGAAGALIAVALLGTASPASAHAVLLQTDPSPQSTTQTPPTAVRLVFSEPVEVSFGAVRVFDVDANRVDTGSVRRVQGNKEVVAPVRDLKQGTYTVTWRAVSADGHPVYGGFAFYVGAPSTISPQAVEADVGAGEVVGWGYGTVRFFWFAALIGLIGAAAVRRWVWTPSVRDAGLADAPVADGFRRRFARVFPILWGVLLIAGGKSLFFYTASVSGLSLTDSLRGSVLSSTFETSYGRYWMAQTALTLLLLLPVVALVRKRPLWGIGPRVWLGAFGFLAGALCLVTPFNGHARTLGNAGLGVPSVAAHLAAVGVWVGGLGALLVIGGLGWRAAARAEWVTLLRGLVPRFSRVAIVSVAVVVATGTVNAILDLARPSDLWSTTYGRVLLAKIVILVLALALAARHLWVTPRRLAREDSAGAEARSFARTGTVEVVLLAGAVALASALVTLVPGKSLALAGSGPVSQERQAGPYTVQLFVDQTAEPNQIHLTFVNAQGLGAAEVTNATATLAPAGAPPQDLELRLISPGHFVAEVDELRSGRYRLDVTGRGAVEASTTFNFKLSERKA
jgi:copper transport protein